MCSHLMNQLYQAPADSQVYSTDDRSWLCRINGGLWSIHTTTVLK